MARTGNHGIVVPRDRALLSRLYWQEQMTLPEMGEFFGVGHRSVQNVMVALGIPTRGRGRASKVKTGRCKVCGAPAKNITHAGNGSVYGRLCVEHRREHYNALARAYNKQPTVNKRRKKGIRRWYLIGAIEPIKEEQWIRKGKHLLRSARRIMAAPAPSPAVSEFLSVASAAARTSRRSCRRSLATSSPAA